MVNSIGWTAQQASNFATLVSNNNDPQYLKLVAESGPGIAPGAINDDFGWRSAVMYKATGDPTYAVDSYDKMASKNWPTQSSGSVTGYADQNSMRHRSMTLAMMYGFIAPGISTAQKTNFRDILEFMRVRGFTGQRPMPDGSHGMAPVNADDTDQLIGCYTYNLIMAYVIQDEEPTLSAAILANDPAAGGIGSWAFGGLAFNPSETVLSLRGFLKQITDNAVGGELVESSQYNMNSMCYLMLAIPAVIDFLGVDHWPDVTGQFADAANALAIIQTPGQNGHHQWGDVQNYRGNRLYTRLSPEYMYAAHSNHGRLASIFDKHWAQYGSTTGKEAFFYSTLNPNLTRTALVDGAINSHISNGIGNAYMNSGELNSSGNSSALLIFRRDTSWDHYNKSLGGCQLFRNGTWVLGPEVGYSQSWMRASGSIHPCGIHGGPDEMSRMVYGAQIGSNALYGLGINAGHKYKTSGFNPPPTYCHEYTHSALYVRNSDDSDTIFNWARLHTSKPTERLTRTKFTQTKLSYKIANNRLWNSSFHTKNRHMFHIVLEPGVVPAWNGSLFNYTTGGETMHFGFFPSAPEFDYHIRDTQTDFNATGSNGDEFNPIRYGLLASGTPVGYGTFELFPSTTVDPFQTIACAFHSGSTPTMTEFYATSGGARAISVTSADQVIVIYNAVVGPTPFTVNLGPNGVPLQSPDSVYVSGASIWDTDTIFSQVKDLHYHQMSYAITVTTGVANARVLLVDLDPGRTWTLDTGSGASGIIPTAEGVHDFILPTAGVHILTVTRS